MIRTITQQHTRPYVLKHTHHQRKNFYEICFPIKQNGSEIN